MAKAEIVDGQAYGYRVVLGSAVPGPRGVSRWRARCVCGKEQILYAQSLREALSCGCVNVDSTKRRLLKHGHSSGYTMSRTYRIWAKMLHRCRSEKNDSWRLYGGRGISVCVRWHTFSCFLEDMGEAPADRTLDRIDNDGDYEPGNCRWATSEEQASNTRRNRHITIDGETRTLASWARESGIESTTIHHRLKVGWSPRLAVFTPATSPKNTLRVTREILTRQKESV